MPQRIQRKRTKGWKMPENTIYVGRKSRRSWSDMPDFGNPWRPGLYRGFTHADAVESFRRWLDGDGGYASAGTPPTREEIQKHLRGKNLACWCPLDQPCHADVLLELANSGEA